jgi:uncharacterized protein YndB with AHSA1/START domain
MNPATASDTIVQEIQIHAPAARIFQALADPTERVKWWNAPGRFAMTHAESDLRVGGKWSMKGSGYGQAVTVHGEYREIEPPRVLAFTWNPGWQPDATESLVRFDLDERDGITIVRLTHSGLITDAARSSHRGWADILGLLYAYVSR